MQRHISPEPPTSDPVQDTLMVSTHSRDPHLLAKILSGLHCCSVSPSTQFFPSLLFSGFDAYFFSLLTPTHCLFLLNATAANLSPLSHLTKTSHTRNPCNFQQWRSLVRFHYFLIRQFNKSYSICYMKILSIFDSMVIQF